jgi:hypothetical protein
MGTTSGVAEWNHAHMIKSPRCIGVWARPCPSIGLGILTPSLSLSRERERALGGFASCVGIQQQCSAGDGKLKNGVDPTGTGYHKAVGAPLPWLGCPMPKDIPLWGAPPADRCPDGPPVMHACVNDELRCTPQAVSPKRGVRLEKNTTIQKGACALLPTNNAYAACLGP